MYERQGVLFQEEISVLPGWGSWAGQQKEPHWMKAANQKAQKYAVAKPSTNSSHFCELCRDANMCGCCVGSVPVLTLMYACVQMQSVVPPLCRCFPGRF